MDLDELRSAQSRERQASQLQHLRDGFYEEAASFIRSLRTERKRTAERSEYGFAADDPEVQRLTDEIKTAEEVVESLYERRVGKVVKMASFDAAGMAVDAEGLTTEEADLFETLVGDIEANRARVLDALSGAAGDAAGTGAGGTASDTPDAPPATDATDAGRDSAPADAGRGALADEARPAEAGDEPSGDDPVHIGSRPAAEGPVSTADREGADEPASDPAPAPEAGGRQEAAPETTRSESRDAPAHDPGELPDATAPAPADDGMDAASAMGAGSDSDARGRSGEVPGGVPDGPPPSPTDEPGTSDRSTASGTETAEPRPDAGTDHQPVPPADGPPGGDRPAGEAAAAADAASEPAADPESDTGTDPAAARPPGESSAATNPSADAEGGVGASGGGDPADPSAGSLVRVTADVGEIFGVDGRAYDLGAGDVVTLPAENAAPLVEEGSAEPLDAPVAPDQSNRS